MARAAIYCRISKANDRVPKVKVQEQMGRDLLTRHGHHAVLVESDDGISATSGAHRPGWERLLAALQAGKFDVLVAQSEDRFTRNTAEKDVLAVLSAAHGVTWLTVNEGVTDPSTADGEFFSILRAGLGRMESKRKAERQRQANDAVRAKGRMLAGGERPFGYKADKKRLKQSEAVLIAQAYKDLVSGEKSVGNIRTEWNNAGVLTIRGNRWDAAKVEKVLRRGRNARLVQVRGELLKDASGEYVRGKWKRIVSDDTYWDAQALLRDPKRRLTRVNEARWLMSSRATCGACGQRMTSAPRTKGTAYRCAVHAGTGPKVPGVRHVSISTAELEGVVIEAVVAAVLHAPTEGMPKGDTETLRTALRRRSEISEARTRLLDLMDGDTDVADIKAKRAALLIESDGLEQEISAIKSRNARAELLTEAQADLWSGRRVSIEDAVEARREIRERFKALDLDSQRAIIGGMLKVVVHNGRGPGRIEITHLVATSLNEEGISA